MSGSSLSKAWVAFPLVGWLVMSLIFFAAWNETNSSHDRYLIADMASAYNLALDIAADPSAMLDWVLPSANYLFPEQIVLVPFAASGWRFDEVIPYYGAVMLVILAIGSFALAIQIVSPQSAAAVSTLTVAAVGAMPVIGAYPGYLLAAPNFHASIPALLPAVLAFVINSAKRRPSDAGAWRGAIPALLTAAALGFSDRLTLVCLTAPLLAGLCIAAIAMAPYRRGCLSLGLALLCFSGGGALLDFLWRPDNPGAHVGLAIGEFFSNSVDIWRLSGNLRDSLPWTFYATLATPLAGICALVAALRSSSRTREDLAWMIVCGTVTAYYPLVHVVHAASTLEPVVYYRLTDIVLACLFLPLLAARMATRLGGERLGMAGLAALALLSTGHAARSWPHRSFGTPLLWPFVQCLDNLALRDGLQFGAGEYWDAIPVRPLSRAGLDVVSVGPQLRPRPWNQTRRIPPDRPYDFVVDNPGIDRMALERLGTPRAVETCGNRTILIFKP